jgi:hypothetical protein
MTMSTASGQGETQGGVQGGREFSLTASPVNLPASTSENNVQGGTAQATVNDQKSPETRDRSTLREGSSLSMDAGDQATAVSRWVTNPQRKPDREDVTVHLPVELPSLTTPVSRTLLAILVELTTVDMLNTPPGRGPE